MSKKSWKEHFLSSGVPLEHSVSQIFEKLEAWDPGEFTYEREDETGTPRVFSVDIHSSHIDVKRNFWLESLVECKYRHDGTKWLFTPREYNPLFGRDFDELFVVLDQCCGDREVNRVALGSFRSNYPLCTKGIEILPDNANPKTIEEAVQQLRYAVVAKSLDALQHQIDELLGKPTPIFIIVPIIVTTSELWRLKPGVTVDDVRAADQIEEIADTHDLLVLLQEPDKLDRKSAEGAFQRELNASQRLKLDHLLRTTSKRGLDSFVQDFSSNKPSLFVIMRYDRFPSAITNLHKFFEQQRMVKARSSG